MKNKILERHASEYGTLKNQHMLWIEKINLMGESLVFPGFLAMHKPRKMMVYIFDHGFHATPIPPSNSNRGHDGGQISRPVFVYLDLDGTSDFGPVEEFVIIDMKDEEKIYV